MALYALLESHADVWTLECHADVWSMFRLVYLMSKAGSLVCLASKTSHTFVLYSLQECEVEGKIILSYDILFSIFPFACSHRF